MEALSRSHDIFVLMLSAIFLEAAPFLLVAALLSAVSEIYLNQDRISRFVPRSPILQVLVALGAGLILPTCECGVVLIARRFMHKGVPPLMAVTYMLAAPIINPLVMVSTYLAFRGNLWMVFGRVFLAVTCASFTGIAVAGLSRTGLLRMGSSSGSLPMAREAPPEHACTHGCACGCGHSHDPKRSNLLAILVHTASEFIEMSKYLIAGAFAAALFKVFVPQDILFHFESNPFLSIGVMMLMAILLSVCSEADSFVAASFWSFSQPAQLAFVSIGPMVDLKLIGAYGATFRKRAALTLIAAPIVIIYTLSAVIASIVG
jgi:uncharacterized membrane protein YraQ (UPF0718 family)